MKTLSKLTSLVLVSAGLIAAPVAMAQPASGKAATKAEHVHKKANKAKKQAVDKRCTHLELTAHYHKFTNGGNLGAKLFS